jgi:glycosyltransferase involved in cell wall biosynthesis
MCRGRLVDPKVDAPFRHYVARAADEASKPAAALNHRAMLAIRSDMTTPLISVVTPAYNASGFIAETIRSVQNQSLTDWEHIVIDDGSTDDTVAVVEQVGDARLRLIRQENAGQSAAQNAGLAAAKGARIVMLDADDLMLDGAFRRLSDALDAFPRAVLAYGKSWLIDPEGYPSGARQILADGTEMIGLEDILHQNLIVSGGAAMIRAEVMRAAGGFDAEVRMAQDWECWCRLATKGPFAAIGGEAVLEYRLHPQSVSRLDAQMPENSELAISKVFENPDVQALVPPDRLARIRRKREGFGWYLAGVETLRLHQTHRARGLIWGSLKRDPMRWRAWVLFGLTCLGGVPDVIGKRIGIPPRKSEP